MPKKKPDPEVARQLDLARQAMCFAQEILNAATIRLGRIARGKKNIKLYSDAFDITSDVMKLAKELKEARDKADGY